MKRNKTKKKGQQLVGKFHFSTCPDHHTRIARGWHTDPRLEKANASPARRYCTRNRERLSIRAAPCIVLHLLRHRDPTLSAFPRRDENSARTRDKRRSKGRNWKDVRATLSNRVRRLFSTNSFLRLSPSVSPFFFVSFLFGKIWKICCLWLFQT